MSNWLTSDACYYQFSFDCSSLSFAAGTCEPKQLGSWE